MNKKLIFKILGIILGIEGVSLLIPFVIALVCRENTAVFGVTALLCGESPLEGSIPFDVGRYREQLGEIDV